MNRLLKINLTIGILATSPIVLSATEATLEPELYVQKQYESLSGQLRGGMRIAIGRIVSKVPHSGFQVWSDALRSGSQSHRYELAGEAYPEHRLRIRMEQNGWMPDNERQLGIVSYTSDESATFYVVVDGEQNVPADRYNINIKGAILLFPAEKTR